MSSPPTTPDPPQTDHVQPLPSRFYALGSQQPFARSASKRSSVLALGSIQHLQHSFTKIGLLADSSPVPLEDSVGGREGGRKRVPPLAMNAIRGMGGRTRDDLPPTPAKPVVDTRMPWDMVEDAGVGLRGDKEWRKEVLERLESVCDQWGLVSHSSHPRRFSSDTTNPLQVPPYVPPLPLPSTTIISSLLSTTTLAIRTMQQYVAVLPTDTSSLCSSPSTYVHPSPLTKPSPAINNFDDLLNNLRKSSIQLLTALKEMRLRFKIDDSSSDEETWEYKTHVGLDDVIPEGLLVRNWIECVDAILLSSRREKSIVDAVFAVKDKVSRRGSRGHRRSSHVESVAEVIGEESEQSLASTLTGEIEVVPPTSLEPESRVNLDRAFALINSTLPSYSPLPFPPPSHSSSSKLSFLSLLSDGTLLCTSYNALLRSSARPFGFIPPTSIHELQLPGMSEEEVRTSGEGSKRVGRTFRRVENLRVWAAAIKFRYSINLSSHTLHLKVPPFDAKLIARKEEGWERMLEEAVVRWIETVCEEMRVEGNDS